MIGTCGALLILASYEAFLNSQFNTCKKSILKVCTNSFSCSFCLNLSTFLKYVAYLPFSFYMLVVVGTQTTTGFYGAFHTRL